MISKKISIAVGVAALLSVSFYLGRYRVLQNLFAQPSKLDLLVRETVGGYSQNKAFMEAIRGMNADEARDFTEENWPTPMPPFAPVCGRAVGYQALL